MGTFLKMFLIALMITCGACSKQAPAKKKDVTHVVVLYPRDYEKSEWWDPQNYDLAEEE